MQIEILILRRQLNLPRPHTGGPWHDRDSERGEERSSNGSNTAAVRIVATNLHSARRRILSVSDAIERTARAAGHSLHNQGHPPALSDFIHGDGVSKRRRERKDQPRVCDRRGKRADHFRSLSAKATAARA